MSATSCGLQGKLISDIGPLSCSSPPAITCCPNLSSTPPSQQPLILPQALPHTLPTPPPKVLVQPLPLVAQQPRGLDIRGALVVGVLEQADDAEQDGLGG